MTFTLAHLSDAHLSPAPFPGWKEMRLKRFMGYLNWRRERVRVNDMGALARLVADMLGHKPDHIAMTGDVVNIALALEFKRAVEWLKSFGDPEEVSFTPGNHDAYVRDAMEGLARSFQPWTRGDGVAPGAEKFPYLRVRKDIAIIGLNSGVPTAPLLASGKLGEAQLAELPPLLELGARKRAGARRAHSSSAAWPGADPLLRGLNDSREFEHIVEVHGAEADPARPYAQATAQFPAFARDPPRERQSAGIRRALVFVDVARSAPARRVFPYPIRARRRGLAHPCAGEGSVGQRRNGRARAARLVAGGADPVVAGGVDP